MRRAFVFVLLAASLEFAAGPSSAAPPQALILRGSRSASTVVDFPKPVTFEMYDKNDSYGRGITADLGGSYAGFAVRRTDGRLVFARLVPRGFETTVHAPYRNVVALGDLRENVVVPAGRYRVSLLTDGQSEIRIRTRGLPGTRVLAPTGPERFRAARLDLRVAEPGPLGYGKVEDVDVRAGSVPVLASFHEFTGEARDRVDYCFTNEPDCDVSLTGGHGGSEGYGHAGGSQHRFGSPLTFAPGRYDVLFRFVGTGVPVSMSGFVAVID